LLARRQDGHAVVARDPRHVTAIRVQLFGRRVAPQSRQRVLRGGRLSGAAIGVLFLQIESLLLTIGRSGVARIFARGSGVARIPVREHRRELRGIGLRERTERSFVEPHRRDELRIELTRAECLRERIVRLVLRGLALLLLVEHGELLGLVRLAQHVLHLILAALLRGAETTRDRFPDRRRVPVVRRAGRCDPGAHAHQRLHRELVLQLRRVHAELRGHRGVDLLHAAEHAAEAIEESGLLWRIRVRARIARAAAADEVEQTHVSSP
jgi:hypothetical protein